MPASKNTRRFLTPAKDYLVGDEVFMASESSVGMTHARVAHIDGADVFVRVHGVDGMVEVDAEDVCWVSERAVRWPDGAIDSTSTRSPYPLRAA